MRVCEVCGKEIHEGHYMYHESLESFYLCVDCFEKFYSKEVAQFMYDNELQYYTEWSEEDDDNA